MRHQQHMKLKLCVHQSDTDLARGQSFRPQIPSLQCLVQRHGQKRGNDGFQDGRVNGGGGGAEEHLAHCERIEGSVTMMGSLRLAF